MPGLLLSEGLAVGTLVLGGIRLVGSHQDAVQRAVVLAVAVVSTGLDGAFDTLVGMAVHSLIPPFLNFSPSMSRLLKNIPEKYANIAF